MSKKNRKAKKAKNTEIKSAEANVEITESVQSSPQSEALPSEPHLKNEDVEMPIGEEQASSENPITSVAAEQETSAEDLLDDVRRSLIEDEEVQEEEKSSKWWRRKGKKEKPPQEEVPAVTVEIDLPAVTALSDLGEEPTEEKEPEEYLDEIDELIDILETEAEEETDKTAVAVDEETPLEPAQEIDIEELKKQAFRPRAVDEEPEDSSEVRTVALSGEEDVFVEVQSQVSDPLEERLSAFENALRPYRRYINMAFALLGVAMAVVASLIIFNVYQQSRPKTVQEISNLPYPTSVRLPGGWSFPLGRGTLQEGKWEPHGAEWLEGTEVCRWVALPWSLQLEAVVRTLNPKDPIELVMSNNDELVYQVYSVRQLSPEEMQELDSSSPCLLLILTESDSEKRWVLTALP